jgi:hypothetical protein
MQLRLVAHLLSACAECGAGLEIRDLREGSTASLKASNDLRDFASFLGNFI